MLDESQLDRIAPAQRRLWREWLDVCEVLGFTPGHGSHLLPLVATSHNKPYTKKDPQHAR